MHVLINADSSGSTQNRAVKVPTKPPTQGAPPNENDIIHNADRSDLFLSDIPTNSEPIARTKIPVERLICFPHATRFHFVWVGECLWLNALGG